MTKKITVKEAKQKLIDSITNERRTFDMRKFTTANDDTRPATCGTASCMAGHIEACWPSVAKRIAKQHIKEGLESHGLGEVDHESLACQVWEEVTGQVCRFDFSGSKYNDPLTYEEQMDTDEVWFEATREEAVAHIRGRSKKWPLLDK